MDIAGLDKAIDGMRAKLEKLPEKERVAVIENSQAQFVAMLDRVMDPINKMYILNKGVGVFDEKAAEINSIFINTQSLVEFVYDFTQKYLKENGLQK